MENMKLQDKRRGKKRKLCITEELPIKVGENERKNLGGGGEVLSGPHFKGIFYSRWSP